MKPPVSVESIARDVKSSVSMSVDGYRLSCPLEDSLISKFRQYQPGVRQLKAGKSGFTRQDEPQRGCILQPNVAVAATLGNRNEIGSVNRNAVAPVLKAGVFHLRLYAAGHNPSGLGKSLPPAPKVAATATLGWRMEPLCGCSDKSALLSLAHWTGITSLTEPAEED